MARFFIDRPVFAWVIAIVIMVAGAVSIIELPVAQYPNIAPPQISIQATYPGASAKTLEDSVTQVIEQRLNGIDHLRYIESSSDATGNVSINITFNSEADPDIAQVQVQNKLALAMPLLPQEVQQLGVRVTKSVRNFLMIVSLVSTDGSMSAPDINDFVISRLQDPISRVKGVGEIQAFGSAYAMRIWLDPAKLTHFALMPSDVSAAIRAQNVQVSAGQLGGMPAAEGQRINATVNAQARLETPEQFGAILLKVNPDGSQVRLRDVARVELGPESYEISGRFKRMASAGMAIRPATGANALETIDAVRAKLDELKPYFPEGIEIFYPLDTSPFIRISITEVIHTLVEAVILVFFVMYLFLQNWRATLIPTIAVPVVLLGTFGIMAAFGFSINTLTMFGIVLAIGLLVDDAIVVVENVERVMSEEGLPPRQATQKSMQQIIGALVGIALVLSAVFVPMAFFSGSTGEIYRQFSITIVSAMGLSVLVAIVLTPALCATILKPIAKGHHYHDTGFFAWFNRIFDRGTNLYVNGVGGMLRRKARFFVVYLVVVVGMGWLFTLVPTGFLPDEDSGLLFAQAQLPPGSTYEQTMAVLEDIEDHFLETETENVYGMFGIVGFSFSGFGQNQAAAFVRLKDWSERKRPDQAVAALQGRFLQKFLPRKDALAVAFMPPAVMELGTANGLDMRLTDNAALGHEALTAARQQLINLANADPRFVNARSNSMDDTAQFKIDIDQEKAAALGIAISDINSTLSTAWGSAYINDFIDRGRTKRVYMRGDTTSRMKPEDLEQWHVRNNRGEMVPFSAFATGSWQLGAASLERFNGNPSTSIAAIPAPGISTGEAMTAITELAGQLPDGFGIEWVGLSYEERSAGSQAPALYAISILVVFLCLAALYESWSVPASVMTIVPLGIIGTLAAALLRGMPNDVYFQVGLLTIVGLSAKNAILIVEFAKAGFDNGMSLFDATIQAARQRLRPILMTSLAFGLGVLPLAISTGAGAGSRNAIGTGVLGGTFTATVLGIFFVPLFFVVILRLFRVKPNTLITAKKEDS